MKGKFKCCIRNIDSDKRPRLFHEKINGENKYKPFQFLSRLFLKVKEQLMRCKKNTTL